MAIVQTKAAEYMQAHQDELSSHQVISLLLDGALERVDQAKESVAQNASSDTEVLVTKLIGIIDGLRGLLNKEQGGEIAANLDTLYGYMMNRLKQVDLTSALVEVRALISQIKAGWDAMDMTEQAIAS